MMVSTAYDSLKVCTVGLLRDVIMLVRATITPVANGVVPRVGGVVPAVGCCHPVSVATYSGLVIVHFATG